MRKKNFRKTLIVGGLLLVFLLPVLIEAANVHWAETDIAHLSTNYELSGIFKDNDFDESIRLEDFKVLVREVIDNSYDDIPDAITREAIIYELSKIWAEETGQNLETVPVIMMLIYSDTDEIDLKYRHAATVAYMTEIAKGKAPGVFAPKAEVTYGELAVLINNTKRAIKNDLRYQSREKADEEPGLEKEKIEITGDYQIKDDIVLFDFELVNHYSEAKELQFSSGQQFEIIIRDETGAEVYRYSEGKFFTMALIYKSIEPGKFMNWQDEWDMRDKEGKLVNPGRYQAEIEIMTRLNKDDGEIEDSQLKTVVEFTIREKNQYSLEEIKQENSSQENTKKNYKLREGEIIKGEYAEELIGEIADEVIQAISIKDSEKIAEYVHPENGVRFTPYTYVNIDEDIIFTQTEVKKFFEDKNSYLWGYYDGKGNKINLTPAEYYNEFIYSADFINAEEVGYNIVLSSGNMLENQFEVYDNPIIVEYYFPGFDPDFMGMDWRSLRLVFEEYENKWKLTGIIHNQWTI